MVSFIEKLKQAQADLAAQNADQWRPPLERLHGKIRDDGVERITTQLVFDILEVPQTVEEPARADVWQSLWPSSGGRL